MDNFRKKTFFKRLPKKALEFLLIMVLIAGWLYSGWPQIRVEYKDFSFTYPPAPQKAYAIQTYYLRDTTAGDNCSGSPNTVRDLSTTAGSTDTEISTMPASDLEWNFNETARTILAGTWTVTFYVDHNNSNGNRNISVRLARYNSACTFQEDIIAAVNVAGVKGGQDQTLTVSATPGAITFASGDILVVTFDAQSAGHHDFHYEGASAPWNSRIEFPDESAAATTFEQRAYGWFSNADSSIPGSVLAAQDATSTLSTADAKFRLRLLMLIGTANLAIDGENFKLQFAGKGGGTCPSPSFAYADVATTTSIAFFQNSHASTTDAAPLGPHAEDPTDGGATIVNQDYKEYRDFTNSEAGINTTEDGKWDFSLYDNNATSSSTFCFRVVKSDDTALDTYTVYPALIIASAATGGAGGSSDPSGGGTPTTGGGEGGGATSTESGSGGGDPTTGGGAAGGGGASPTLLDLLNKLIKW